MSVTRARTLCVHSRPTVVTHTPDGTIVRCACHACHQVLLPGKVDDHSIQAAFLFIRASHEVSTKSGGELLLELKDSILKTINDDVADVQLRPQQTITTVLMLVKWLTCGGSKGYPVPVQWLASLMWTQPDPTAVHVVRLLLRCTLLIGDEDRAAPLRPLLCLLCPPGTAGHGMWLLFALKCPEALTAAITEFTRDIDSPEEIARIVLALADVDASRDLKMLLGHSEDKQRCIQASGGEVLPPNVCAGQVLFQRTDSFRKMCRQHPGFSRFQVGACRKARDPSHSCREHRRPNCALETGANCLSAWETIAQSNQLAGQTTVLGTVEVCRKIQTKKMEIIRQSRSQAIGAWDIIVDNLAKSEGLYNFLDTVTRDIKMGEVALKVSADVLSKQRSEKSPNAPQSKPEEAARAGTAAHTAECARLSELLSELQSQLKLTTDAVKVLEAKISKGERRNAELAESNRSLVQTNKKLVAANKKHTNKFGKAQADIKAARAHVIDLEAELQTERNKLGESEGATRALVLSERALRSREEDLQVSLRATVQANEASLYEKKAIADELRLLREEQATKDLESTARLASLQEQVRRLSATRGDVLPDEFDEEDDLFLKKRCILAMLGAVEAAQADFAKRDPECPICFTRNGALFPCPLKGVCVSPGRGMACGECAPKMPKCVACT